LHVENPVDDLVAPTVIGHGVEIGPNEWPTISSWCRGLG
jgi:hypothetical protein